MALIDNLISYWKLDEVAGAVLDSHDANNGTNVGATPNVAGKINTAYDFEAGETDYIDLGDIADGHGAMSVSVWVKPESLISAERQIFSKDSDTRGRSWIFAQILSGKVRWALFDNNNVEWITTTDDVVLSAGTWTHIVVVADISNDLTKIYIDGEEVNVTRTGTVWTGTTVKDSTADLEIGRREYSTHLQPWDGLIDEVGVWNAVKTAEEIGTGAGTLWNNGNGLAYPFVPVTNMKINIGGVLKDVDGMKINIGGVLKDVVQVKQNIGGVLKDVFG